MGDWLVIAIHKADGEYYMVINAETRETDAAIAQRIPVDCHGT